MGVVYIHEYDQVSDNGRRILRGGVMRNRVIS